MLQKNHDDLSTKIEAKLNNKALVTLEEKIQQVIKSASVTVGRGSVQTLQTKLLTMHQAISKLESTIEQQD
jgi:hypothetical protein